MQAHISACNTRSKILCRGQSCGITLYPHHMSFNTSTYCFRVQEVQANYSHFILLNMKYSLLYTFHMNHTLWLFYKFNTALNIAVSFSTIKYIGKVILRCCKPISPFRNDVILEIPITSIKSKYSSLTSMQTHWISIQCTLKHTDFDNKESAFFEV